MRDESFHLAEKEATGAKGVYALHKRNAFFERANGGDGSLKKHRTIVSGDWTTENREHTLDRGSFTNQNLPLSWCCL